MAKQKGSDMLLKIDTTGSLNFMTIGGVQNPRIAIRKGDVDVTNQGSPSKFRELLEGAGITQISISGSGVLDTSSPTPTHVSVTLAGTIRTWQAIVPVLGTFQGYFQCTQFELTGKHDGEISFSFTLENSGVITLS